jgi:hypothetical protein
VSQIIDTFRNPAADDVFIGKNTKYCDLRSGTDSLVLRAHTQHGIFGALAQPKFSNYDMNQYIVAAVKFPIDRFVSFLTQYELITPRYMFPSDYYDNTYKVLHELKISGLVRKIEKSFGLEEGALGTVDKYYE